MKGIKEYVEERKIDKTLIIEGKSLAQKIKDSIKTEISEIRDELGTDVTLAVILIGDDAGSQVYVRNKEKACEQVGIKSITYRLDKDISQAEAEKLILKLATDNNIHGILLQLPVPKQLDSDKLINLIPADKDVDGLTDANAAKVFTDKSGIRPCTPQGVIDLLENYNIDVAGKTAVIIGRSRLVGKPLALMLMQKNATVTICHSKTQNISDITRRADIIICALGKPKFLTADMVSDDCIVIDVGINRLATGLCGDTDYENLINKVYAITPVPGSCGPMTIAELLVNTLKCYKLQQPKQLKPFFTAKDVLTILNISRQTLSNYVKRGLIKIDSNYTGRGYHYNKESVLELLTK